MIGNFAMEKLIQSRNYTIAQSMHWEKMRYKNRILETAGSVISKSQNKDHGYYWPLQMKELKT
jgi:hypothetical protein